MEIEHHKWPSIKDWNSRMAKPWGISINFIEGHEWCSIHWVRVMTALITLLSIQGISTRLFRNLKNREITEFTLCCFSFLNVKKFVKLYCVKWKIKTNAEKLAKSSRESIDDVKRYWHRQWFFKRFWIVIMILIEISGIDNRAWSNSIFSGPGYPNF